MSTLNVSNITDGTTTVGTSYVVNGSAKQWCRWNQTGTAAINDSFNTSSLTDNGTGKGELTYTSNMSNGNYHIATGVGELTGGGNRGIGVRGADQTPIASGCAYFCFNTNWSGADQDLCSTSVFGDLA